MRRSILEIFFQLIKVIRKIQETFTLPVGSFFIRLLLACLGSTLRFLLFSWSKNKKEDLGQSIKPHAAKKRHSTLWRQYSGVDIELGNAAFQVQISFEMVEQGVFAVRLGIANVHEIVDIFQN